MSVPLLRPATLFRPAARRIIPAETVVGNDAGARIGSGVRRVEKARPLLGAFGGNDEIGVPGNCGDLEGHVADNGNLLQGQYSCRISQALQPREA